MWKYIKQYLPYAILAALFMAGEVSMDLVQPGIMRRIVDPNQFKPCRSDIKAPLLCARHIFTRMRPLVRDRRPHQKPGKSERIHRVFFGFQHF